MNKKLILLLVVVCVLAGGWFGYTFWNNSRQSQNRQVLAAQRKEVVDAMPSKVTESYTELGSMSLGSSLPPDNAAGSQEGDFIAVKDTVTGKEKEDIIIKGAPAVPPAVQNAAQTAAKKEVKDAAAIAQSAASAVVERVSFNPATRRDPTISREEQALAELKEKDRMRAAEAARLAREAAARKAKEDLARRLREEEDMKRNPAREVIGKINLQGIVNKEAFINDRVYGVGQSVLGARIISITDGEVLFNYKGQNFTKKIK